MTQPSGSALVGGQTFLDLKTSPSFPEYEISEFGDVRRCLPGKQAIVTGNFLKPALTRLGYFKFGLCRNGKVSTVLRARLVAEAFLGLKPFNGACVCHGDGNRTNDHYTNLRWDTQQANHADMAVHGTKLIGSKKPQAKLVEDSAVEIRRMVSRGEVKKHIAEKFGVSPCVISDILAGRTWSHVA